MSLEVASPRALRQREEVSRATRATHTQTPASITTKTGASTASRRPETVTSKARLKKLWLWLRAAGRPTDTSAASLVEDPALLAAVQAAVDDANLAVSQAEAIKRFIVLPVDFTEEGGQLTPTMKLRRGVVGTDFAADLERLYS